MDVLEIQESDGDLAGVETKRCGTPAAGLFGYSIFDGRMSAFKPTSGYLRDIEQMPNFAPPSIDRFVEQYVSSNIGRTKSSS